MPIISFYTNCKEQTGNTVSALSLATYLGIAHNKKTLLISTSYNENTVRQALWETQTKKKSGLFGPNTAMVSDNGIEGLDRVIRSNKISPNIITDYTKVALTNRLEVLLGYKGMDEHFQEIQKQYPQIATLASKCYDTVIIDIDKNLNPKIISELLDISDVVVAVTTQKMNDIIQLNEKINQGQLLKRYNTIIAIGRYDQKSKYNAKNVSRNLLRQKEMVNTIPYNTALFEAIQEGMAIDIFLKFLSLKGIDDNTFFLEEIKRLGESIEQKYKEILQMKK